MNVIKTCHIIELLDNMMKAKSNVRTMSYHKFIGDYHFMLVSAIGNDNYAYNQSLHLFHDL